MAAVGSQARFNEFLFSAGAASVVRNQMFVPVGGGGDDRRNPRRLPARGRQHADITLVADHVAPAAPAGKCSSPSSTGRPRRFSGQDRRTPACAEDRCQDGTHALLLSEDAEADNKPELEIFADDVQCGHGATSGDLDEDLLFYLKARGIPREAGARRC